MARPIIPVAVRRLDADSPFEVQSRMGLWVGYDHLSFGSQDAVRRAMRADQVASSLLYDSTVFEHTFGVPFDDRGDIPQPIDAPNGDGEQGDDGEQDFQPENNDGDDYDPRNDENGDGGESDSDGEGDNDKDSDGSGQEKEMTIEDIVRKIAGELDSEVASLLVAEMERQISEFTPKHDDFTPIRRVEIIRNEIKMPHDGVFHYQFPKLLRAVGAGQHCYLPGPPGSGKSHAAEQVASVLDWRFASLSLGPTTPESRLWGGKDANGKFFEPPFVTLARYAMNNPESGAVYCLDEMDNGHSGILATMNSALANGWFTAPNGDTVTVGKNFVIVAAANTFGTGPTAKFAGRNKLDPATLDRFAYLPWDTDTAVENTMCRSILHGDNEHVADAWLDAWRTLRHNVDENGLEFFITMRGCLNGARLLAAGFSMDDAMNMVIGSKMPENQWSRVNPL